jgi:hypothetical protein
MFQWIAKSRLRTALAILFFLLLSGLPRALQRLEREILLGPGTPPVDHVLNIAVGIISSVGTISTVILAWRTDRRSAKEADLKLIQLQQQIIELQRKLGTPQEPKPPDSQTV